AITTGPAGPARADHFIQTSQGGGGGRFPRCTRFQSHRPGVSSGVYRCPGPTHVARPRRAAPMSFKMQRVHVYHAEEDDKPGGVSARLKSLAEAGAHLEYVYSQRSATKPGMGDLYVARLHGAN